MNPLIYDAKWNVNFDFGWPCTCKIDKEMSDFVAAAD